MLAAALSKPPDSADSVAGLALNSPQLLPVGRVQGNSGSPLMTDLPQLADTGQGRYIRQAQRSALRAHSQGCSAAHRSDLRVRNPCQVGLKAQTFSGRATWHTALRTQKHHSAATQHSIFPGLQTPSRLAHH